MNEQDMVKKLKNDPAALRSVMQSADGRALLGMLSGGDTAALAALHSRPPPVTCRRCPPCSSV